MSDSFYKYRSFNRFTNNIILNSSLYFSSPNNFNDPFDCQLSYKDKYTKREIKDFFIDLLKQNSHENYRLKDLLKNPSSILMWSHYSDNHKGLVFEFKPFKNSLCFETPIPPISVKYVKSYIPLSYAHTREELHKYQQDILLTKFVDWRYEEEYRVLHLEEQGERKFEKGELLSIIFGAEATDKNINDMILLRKKNNFTHVKFKKAKKVFGLLSLSFEDIN